MKIGRSQYENYIKLFYQLQRSEGYSSHDGFYKFVKEVCQCCMAGFAKEHRESHALSIVLQVNPERSGAFAKRKPKRGILLRQRVRAVLRSRAAARIWT